MVDDKKLSSVLSEFALTLATDFSIASILDHLVVQIVGIMPVTSAGVTLIGPEEEPHHVAASDDSALRFEQLQTSLQQGPCLLAYESGDAVSVSDLARDDRFPRFGPAALEAGMQAVFAFPMHHGRRRLGALDLYRDTAGDLNGGAMEAAQTLADVAAAYILNARARERARLSSDQLRHVATHDPLTALPNRMLLLQRIDHAAQRALRSRAAAAVLFIDMDRFKRVNDTYGHDSGDDLLRQVGDRLSAVVRPGDTLARVYGDEFVLLCEDLNDEHDAEGVADRIRAAFDAPFRLNDSDLTMSASVGVAYAGPGSKISTALIGDADREMYKIKSGVTDRLPGAVHSLPTQARSVVLARDLRVALEHDDLDVAYQPIVGCRDGVIAALEVLLRWTHPTEGAIPPLSAVAVAERTGSIRALGAWVMERGFVDRVRWQSEHPDAAFDLAVNVSSLQLMAPHFVDEVGAILSRTGMTPADVVLEITESVLIEDPERARLVLMGLKDLGLRIALDDFGTGYSSLSYLHRLPIDILKIDREFIADSGEAGKSDAILAAVTDLAHALDLVVVIEGIETLRDRSAAARVGAELAQGFFYARPVPARSIDAMLRAARSSALPLKLPLQRLPRGQPTRSR